MNNILVGIMTHNRPRLLDLAFESILNQKYPIENIGVIFGINDAKQEVYDVINKFAKDPRTQKMKNFYYWIADYNDIEDQEGITSANRMRMWAKHMYFKNEAFFKFADIEGYDYFIDMHDDFYLPHDTLSKYLEVFRKRTTTNNIGVVGGVSPHKAGYCPLDEIGWMQGKFGAWNLDQSNVTEKQLKNSPGRDLEVAYLMNWMCNKDVFTQFKLTVPSKEWIRSAHSKFFYDIREAGYKILLRKDVYIPHYYSRNDHLIMA